MKGNKIAIDRYLETGEVVDSLDLSVNYLVKYVREGGTVPLVLKNKITWCSTTDGTGATYVEENTDTVLSTLTAPSGYSYLIGINGNCYTSISGFTTPNSNYLQEFITPRVTTISSNVENIGSAPNGCVVDFRGLKTIGGNFLRFSYIKGDVDLPSLESISSSSYVLTRSTVLGDVSIGMVSINELGTDFCFNSTLEDLIFEEAVETTRNISIKPTSNGRMYLPKLPTTSNNITYGTRTSSKILDMPELLTSKNLTSGIIKAPKLVNTSYFSVDCKEFYADSLTYMPSFSGYETTIYIPSFVSVTNISSSNLISLTYSPSSIGLTSSYSLKCQNLQSLTLPRTDKLVELGSVLSDRFSISDTCIIYVPDIFVNDYKSATNWSRFADRIKGISERPTT